MSKYTQYVCDVCERTSHVEAQMTSVSVALSNAVRVRESIHIHHEHVCPDCIDRIKRALNVDEAGKPNVQRIVQLRHAG